MSDTTSVIDNAQPADDEQTLPPASEETKADAAETSDDTTDDGDDAEHPDLPRGVKKRIDKLTKAKHELTRQNLEAQVRMKELEARIAQLDRPATPQEPDPSQFDDWDKYLQAKVDFEASKRLQQVESQRSVEQQQAARLQSFNERAAAVRQANPDFDSVLQTAAVAVSDAVMDTILDTEDGPNVAYYLAKNPLELLRLNTLPERQQVLELGRISARLSTKPEPRRVSSAPEPVKPAGRTASPPRRIEDARSMEEHARMRNEQLAKTRR